MWKESRKLGVGVATSEDERIFVVCNYVPAGNDPDKFGRNVDPPPEFSRAQVKEDSTYLGVDAGYVFPQNLDVLLLALGAALFVAVGAQVAVALFRADAAALHYLAARGIRQLARYLDVQLQEPLQGHVRGKSLHALYLSYDRLIY